MKTRKGAGLMTFNVPDGYVLLPRALYDYLWADAKAWREFQGALNPVEDTQEHNPALGKMPICGCPVGSACANIACPHRLEVTCGTTIKEGGE